MPELSKNSILYTPDDHKKALGVIQILHDFGEHQNRYKNIAQTLTENGYAVITSDIRGHGNNISRNAELGFMGDNAPSGIIGDIHENRTYARNIFPDIPFLIIAQGAGCLIATAYFKKYDNCVDGMFLLGMPADRKSRYILKYVIMLLSALKGEYFRSSFISGLIYGSLSDKFPQEKDPFAWISSDHKEVEAYQNDSRCGFIPTLNSFSALLDFFNMVYGKSSWIHKKTKCPIRLFAGDDDP
ncbi:MAG: alpha/beta hydrolase, partial [Parasporobacterium sp.]|nr:alpha/beta hydrolase [Parasporobacterium sp.]